MSKQDKPLKCGHVAPDWNGEGDCITCARNKVLGNTDNQCLKANCQKEPLPGYTVCQDHFLDESYDGSDSQDELSAIKGAIGWANPQQRIDAVQRLVTEKELAVLSQLEDLYCNDENIMLDYLQMRIATLTNQPNRRSE